MYFIYSEDCFLLKERINKIIKQITQTNQVEVQNFSLIEDDFDDIYQSVTNLSFFNDKNVIVINDAYFVSESKVNFNKNFSITKLEQMLKKYNPNNLIIFTMNTNNFSKRLKIAKFIEQHCNLEYLKSFDQQKIIAYITNYLKQQNKTIDRNLAFQIYQYLPNDLQIITNELNKLASLEQAITIDLVWSVCAKYHQQDIFGLVDAFVNNNLDKFIKLLKDYLLLNDDIIGLISLLNASLSFYRDVLLLKQSSKTQQQIASILKAHQYRVQLALNSNYDINKLNDKIKLIYKIFKGIVTSKMDKQIIVEYELIKNMRG
ncbi:DNA polymerase III subunit delta [Mycoplasma putrefaciens]|uniref:DNA polymerase III subunit delta n=1 Tax=Mycoplasma putrefaciens TaxID=2123 RepID=UPI003DA514FD